MKEELLRLAERRCKHLNARLFTRDGEEHTGLDLFARCPDCGFEGLDFPHIEHNPGEVTPKMRRELLAVFHQDAAALRASVKEQNNGK